MSCSFVRGGWIFIHNSIINTAKMTFRQGRYSISTCMALLLQPSLLVRMIVESACLPTMVTLKDLVCRPGFCLTTSIKSTVKSLSRELEALTGHIYSNTNILYPLAESLTDRFRRKKDPPDKFKRSPSNQNWMSLQEVKATFLS